MNLSMRRLIIGAVLGMLIPLNVAAAGYPGFIIAADDRFDPAIQRLMAELELEALPLDRGQLYYLYPAGFTPRLEGAQIRYLEALLDKRADEDTAAAANAPERADPDEATGRE